MELHAVVIGGAGVLTGLAGALPAVSCMHRARRPKRVTVGMGLAATIMSFLFLTAVLSLVCFAAQEYFRLFAVACMAAFMVAVATEAARAWIWMNRR